MPLPRTAVRLAVAAGLLAVATGCQIDGEEPAPTETGDYQSVELEVIEQQGLTLAFVPVTISGEGPFRFALDTGASSTVVASDVVDQVGLEPTGEERRVTGIIGADVVGVVEVTEWSLGDVSLDRAEISIIDLPSGQGAELQGLFGSDVLSRFGRITVDYDRGLLQLAPR